ncbi:DUF616 domain-containing protein [Reyranella sp. MMS21-HV4-11]|uniref:DUF616 domain-containing protein n=1 Tax=Reyranella humidisoli TaxID=2849149 RepID=A0ABS6ILI6_9HYPH|nr:glycosyltransferase domain-containing protein [Reyranella sp. MMS21-HV4-11]MBU8875459.1 DUF616 domain-containing protein [Reyranella sp. MMS21-HV4-11]
MKTARGALQFSLIRLKSRVRVATERFAPRVARFLIDSLGIMALPGYRALARLVLHRWVCAIDAAIERDFYLEQVEPGARRGAARDPALHYCLTGWMQGFSPALRFDPAAYRHAATGLHWAADPFLHHVEHQAWRDRLGQSVSAVVPPPLAVVPVPSGRERATGRCVIYTAVAGGYDVVRAPEFVPDNCDFVLLSDQPLDAKGWKVRPLIYDHPDPRRAARHAKLHPHLYFPEYRHSLWIDANIGVRGDAGRFVDALTDDSAVGVFSHPTRDCVFDEGDEWIGRKDPEAEAIARQLGHYRMEGHPAGSGLWETSVMVRRHHDPSCIALMTDWWREIERGSARDQVSFPIAARRQSRIVATLAPPGVHARNHPHLTSAPHLQFRLQPDPTLPPLSAERREVRLGALSLTLVILGEDETSDASRLLAGFDRRGSRVVFAGREADVVSVNAILEAADGDWIVLLKGGTTLATDALCKLVATGEQAPRLGVIGPLSTALLAEGGEVAAVETLERLPVDEVSALCAAASDGRYLLIPWVDGPCVAIRRSMLGAVGALEEVAFGSVWDAVLDLCLRAEDRGFVNCISGETFARGQTITADFFPLQSEALRTRHGRERLEMATDRIRIHPGLVALRRRIVELASRYGKGAD